MALVTKPYTFSQGTIIVASEHNSNFDTIYADYNGNITNANISASAALAYSKMTLTNSIVNADINSSAAIADSKLAQITTASKVSGAAVTSLSSVPSGAGQIPVANLGTGTPSATTALYGDGAWKASGIAYGFSVYLSTEQALTSGSKVPFDSEVFDIAGNFASNKFTAPVDGYYHFGSTVNCASGGTGTTIFTIEIYKNGSSVKKFSHATGGNGTSFSISVDSILSLSATNYIEIYITHDKGSALTMGAGDTLSYFWGYKL